MNNKFVTKALSAFTAAAMLISPITGTPFGEFDLGITAYAEELPTSYTPSLLLGIENQGNTNLCWAFSGTSAIEYNILKNSSAYTSEQLSAMQQDGEIDLYEKALAYYTLNPKTADTTDLTYGSGGTNLGNTTALYETGGGPLMLVWQLARWSGPVSYANEPDTYELASITSSDVADEFNRYDSLAHLQNAKVIYKDDANALANIKQAIIDYGAVATGILTNTSYYNTTPAVANDGRYAFYLPSTGNSTGAHAVAIVGWDDSYSAENFLESSRPSTDGAWLCRNSTPLDGSGYFWMSYEQIFAENPIAFDMEPNDNYDNNYQYSGSEGSQHSLNVGNTGITYAINVFTAEDDEVLEAVSFFTDASTLSGGSTVPANYTVKIIKDFTAFDEIGNTAFTAVQLPEADVEISGTTENFYTTVEFAPITLKAGEKYAVCVNTNHNGRERYYVDGGNQSAGRSYVYFNGYAIDTYTDDSETITTKNYGTVSNVGGYTALMGGNFQIRAFTSDIDKYTITANDDGTHTLTRNKYGRVGTEEHTLTLTEVDRTNHNESCSVCNYTAAVEHTYECTNDGDPSLHIAACGCGYTTRKDHELEYDSKDNIYHIASCSKCSYEKEESHNLFAIEYISADEHVEKCDNCEFTNTTAHKLEYTPNNDGTHTYTCFMCGELYTPVSEDCTYVNGRCAYCEEVASGVAYIDPTAAEPNKLCEEYTELTSGMTALNAGWYYVDGAITINGAVTVNGDVDLILADGCALTVSGVTVNAGNSLTIYGQKNGTGTLASTGTDVAAGIGSFNGSASGDITINGGTIVATGAGQAAGIGGCSGNASGTITINGGDITATGGTGTYAGTGIGGGGNAGCGDIIINGGVIKAYGATSTYGDNWGSAAIGGGTMAGSCGSITINSVCQLEAVAVGDRRAIGTYDGAGSCIITISDTLTIYNGTGDSKTETDSVSGKTSVTITGAHKGGTATCVSNANCVACGEEYGYLDSTNHINKADEYSYDETHHWYECDCGEADKAEHISGGAATQTTPEICTVCGYEIAPATGAFIIYDSNVSLSEDTFTYNESEQKPSVTVTKGNTTLTENTDYTLAFSADSTNAGEKTVTVTGTGNYSGTVELTYTIERAVLDDIGIEVVAPVAGEAAQNSVTAADGYTADIAWSPAETTFGYNTAYTATVTLATDDNHKFDSSMSVIDWSVSFNNDYTIATLTRTFDKTERAVQTITADDVTLIYGDTDGKITATTDGDGAITYEVTTGTDVISVDANGSITILKAGTATVTISAAETDTYAAATKAITVTVNNAPSVGSEIISISEKNGVVTLAWTAVDNATSYRIYRADTATGTKTLIKTVGITSCNDTTATFGSTYYYFVQAYNSKTGTAYPYSEYKSIKLTSLAAPTLNSVTVDENVVNLSWSAVPNATSYRVYRGTSATGSDMALLKTVSTTSCNNTSVTAGTTYYYYVVAYSSKTGTMSAASNTKSVTIASSLSAPTLSSVTQAKGKINIAWSAVDGATSYKVYRATSATGTKTLLKTVGITSCTDTTATFGTTYYYFVQAYSSKTGATSAYSGYKSLKFTSLAPPTLNSVTTDGTAVNLSWSAVSNATSYRVYRGTSATGAKSLLKTVSTTSCNNTSVTAGTTYYYYVVAYSSKTETMSAASNTKSVTIENSLSAPTLSSVTQAKGKVNIAWSTVDGATSYRVYRATSATGTKTLLKTVGITSCEDTTAAFGTTYYYFVQAYSSKTATTSDFSGYKSLKFTSLAPPTLNSVTVDGNTVNLSWTAVPNATSYRIYRGTSATGAKSLLKTVGITSCNNTSVTAGTTYYYYVVAYSSKTDTMSAASNTKSITV